MYKTSLLKSLISSLSQVTLTVLMLPTRILSACLARPYIHISGEGMLTTEENCFAWLSKLCLVEEYLLYSLSPAWGYFKHPSIGL